MHGIRRQIRSHRAADAFQEPDVLRLLIDFLAQEIHASLVLHHRKAAQSRFFQLSPFAAAKIQQQPGVILRKAQGLDDRFPDIFDTIR